MDVVDQRHQRNTAMRPKVLLIARWFPPTVGGIERYLEKLYRELTVLCDVTVVAPRGQSGHPGSPYRVIEASVSRRWGLGSKWPVVTLGLRALRPGRQVDVIAAGHVLTGVVAIFLGLVCRKPTVVHVYGMELTNGKLLRLKAAVLKRASAVISISAYSTELLDQMGVRSDRIIEIPPGVDTSLFAGQGANDATKKTVFLTVSRLDPNSRYKGHDVVAEALGRLRHSGHEFEWRIVGSGPDETRLRELIAQEGLEERTVLLGRLSIEDLLNEYQQASVFVMPNRSGPCGESEGFGMVFTEAQACGTPVIAGRAGGTGSSVVDGLGGVRIDGHNVDAVMDSLTDVILRPAVWKQRGMAGQTWVRQHHEWKDRVATLNGLLRGLLAPS